MKVVVRKWGNSLAVRIPRLLADEAGLGEGSVAEISRRDDLLVIEPARQGEYSLARLVDQITEGNRHGEIGTGDAAGKETW